MAYTVGFKPKFAKEFLNLPGEYKSKIWDFKVLFEQHGLSDFTKYPGKIAQSWSGNSTQKDFEFTKKHDLYHYHIGLPEYYQSEHSTYLVSEWVLHFQWINRGYHIDLVDLYSHRRADGSFHIPGTDYIV